MRKSFVAPLALSALILACGTRPDPSATSKTLPDSAFHVEWGSVSMPNSLRPGEKVPVSVTFKNTSVDTWPNPRSTGSTPPEAGAVRLSYRWWTTGSPLPTPYSTRADLRASLKPGESATLVISVVAPTTPGNYQLQFDLVDELAAWFEEKGAATKILPVQVR